jgi:hypothetical protein
MKNRLQSYLVLLFILIFQFFIKNSELSAQALIFHEIQNSTVADTTIISFTLKNNTPNSITNLLLTISLPCSMKYVKNSNEGVSENNISDLSNPVFRLNSIAVDKELIVKAKVYMPCEVYTCLNNGDVFKYKILSSFNNNNKEFISPTFKFLSSINIHFPMLLE